MDQALSAGKYARATLDWFWFCFPWPRKWRELSNANPNQTVTARITFDSQLKTALTIITIIIIIYIPYIMPIDIVLKKKTVSAFDYEAVEVD